MNQATNWSAWRACCVLLLVWAPELAVGQQAVERKRPQTEEQVQRTLDSLESVDDLPLFRLEFSGDYDRLQGADERTRQWLEQQPPIRESPREQSRAETPEVRSVAFWTQGGLSEWKLRTLAASATERSATAAFSTGYRGAQGLDRQGDFACSLFVAHGGGDAPLFGRNFDWLDHPALVLVTRPSDGYVSISLVDISYLGVAEAAKKLDSLRGRRELLDAPLIPFDGLNEHGLAVGMAAVPETQLPFDPAKPTLHGLGIIRLVLDKAINVDEALALYEQFNVVAQGGPPIHYLLADPSGASALVELHDGQRKVFRNEQPWQVATNFYYCDAQDDPQAECHRYARIARRLAETGGELSSPAALQLLQSVAQPNTRWSAVYDLKHRRLSLATARRFQSVHAFELN